MASEMLAPPRLFELPMNELNAVVLFHVVIVVAVNHGLRSGPGARAPGSELPSLQD